ncbi:MAG: DUF6079 family protein, partial [Candidatus Cloacimonetes bacterium]|nr:DUF6079 family protein [Candidatus Cloacimonadota bacterium]MDY0230714.1 DUF6079 family protein [Candidatus Cloacimonadaceae bacterium]
NLKDDLCLFLQMPEDDADFLLSLINTTLKDIMTTVSGQFIIYNDANNQYYIDVDKVVDYDEKIKQKASILADGEIDRYFYAVVYNCLEWNAKQYVTNFNIYEYDLNWDSHSIFREGYLFMGLPGERSTAQPERDFYIHIMPPYSGSVVDVKNLQDEVYFYFKTAGDFKDTLSSFAAANELAQISEGKEKDAYHSKAEMLRKKLVKYLGENKNTCFDVVHKNQKKQLIEVLKGRYKLEHTFKDTLDLAASICLDEYFGQIYPEFPVMKTKITRNNMAENARVAIDHFAGRKSQLSALMLQSFGILEGEKIRPEGSKYAAYYIDKIKQLPGQGVLNYSDLFEPKFMCEYVDKQFHISFIFTPVIFLSLVYAGYAVLTLKNGTTITAANLDTLPKVNVVDLYEFKYIVKPTQLSIVELKLLFETLDLNPSLLDNPNDREKGVEELLKKAQYLCNLAVMASRKLTDDFELWAEPLVNKQQQNLMQKACDDIRNEFSNYTAKYNTPAKLNNFSLSAAAVEELGTQIALIKTIYEYNIFKTDCSVIVSYVSNVEYLDLEAAFKMEIEQAKAKFRTYRDEILNGASGDAAAQKVTTVLAKIKDQYINRYYDEHKKKRLDIDDAKRRGEIQESRTLSNLKKLRAIEILSAVKLTVIEQDLAELKVCYELTPAELKNSTVCPHCRYNLGDKAKNVVGQLDNLEKRIDDLVTEWTQKLLNIISEPIVVSQKDYLSPDQQQAIDNFITTGNLPDVVDDFFVKSINALLKGFEPVIIQTKDLIQKLDELGPCDVDTFKAKIADFVSGYIIGKDTSKLRIVMKHTESEV